MYKPSGFTVWDVLCDSSWPLKFKVETDTFSWRIVLALSISVNACCLIACSLIPENNQPLLSIQTWQLKKQELMKVVNIPNELNALGLHVLPPWKLWVLNATQSSGGVTSHLIFSFVLLSQAGLSVLLKMKLCIWHKTNKMKKKMEELQLPNLGLNSSDCTLSVVDFLALICMEAEGLAVHKLQLFRSNIGCLFTFSAGPGTKLKDVHFNETYLFKTVSDNTKCKKL